MLSLVLSLAFAAPPRIEGTGETAAGEKLAVTVGRVVTMAPGDAIHDPGMVWIEDGKLTYVGAPKAVPEGFEHVERHDTWAVPGMVDLHSHVQTGSWGDINDMVVPTNPELSTSPTIVPSNPHVRRACAAGVTTLFGIPGSGTSMSGFGVLYKTKTRATFDEAVLADPGGLKVAQTHNPERRGGDLGLTRAGLYWLLQDVNDRALAAEGQGRFEPAYANLQKVLTQELPILIHCAGGIGAASVVRMWKLEYGTNCVLSHGSLGGHKVAEYIAREGVPVNHGPRTMAWFSERDSKVLGTAKVFVDAGVPDFSLNTDAGVIPQEELFLQGSVSARLGADPYQMLQAVTIHPARSFGIDDRVGSLEVGKDADVVLWSGDPLDPRSHVELVLIDGDVQYDRVRDGQWF